MPIERWGKPLSVTLLAALLGPTLACAGTPPKRAARPPVDMRLLEFLGSADPTSDEKRADGGSWMLYLSKLNLGKAAKSTGGHASAPGSKPGAAAGPSGVRNR